MCGNYKYNIYKRKNYIFRNTNFPAVNTDAFKRNINIRQLVI